MHIATNSSKFDISKESQTAKLANKFSKILKKGDVIFLIGEIGTGKTTFVKYLINFLEKSKKKKLSEITSPTFSILNEYRVKNLKIRHYDLFRLKKKNDVKNIGLFENINEYITFIEWPEKVSKNFEIKYNIYFRLNLNSKKRFVEINKKNNYL